VLLFAYSVQFEVFNTVNVKNLLIYRVMSPRLIEIYQYFRGINYLSVLEYKVVIISFS